MLNKELVEELLEQARSVEKERASFIQSSDFYTIRDTLFSAVTAMDQNPDTMVAFDIDIASQLVEYVERTEELLHSLMMVIYSQAYGTVAPGWIANQQPFGATK